MNRFHIQVLAAVLASAFALPAFAQARHDEKPHATAKPAAPQAAERRPATGGRHDEGRTTHGMPAAKRAAAPAADAATSRQ